VKPPVHTICIGQAMGTAAMILSAGSKGQRAALPHASIVLHQPRSGTRGQASDIQIRAKEVLHNKRTMLEILAENTGKSVEDLSRDSDRMTYLTAEEAKAYGLIDRVLTSPLVRASQTAEILAAGIACEAPLVMVDALRPGGRYDALLAALGRLGSDRSVALVGHMPSIGDIASRLIGAREPLAFKKGATCCIETDALPPAGTGQLRWFLPPRALRALAH